MGWQSAHGVSYAAQHATPDGQIKNVDLAMLGKSLPGSLPVSLLVVATSPVIQHHQAAALEGVVHRRRPNTPPAHMHAQHSASEVANNRMSRRMVLCARPTATHKPSFLLLQACLQGMLIALRGSHMQT